MSVQYGQNGLNGQFVQLLVEEEKELKQENVFFQMVLEVQIYIAKAKV